MALTGTSWILNEKLTAPSTNLNMQTSQMKFYHFMRAVKKKKTYGKMSMTSNGYLAYATSTDTIGITDAYLNGAWTDQNLRMISFMDTADVTFTPDEETIENWLLANATPVTLNYVVTGKQLTDIANAIREKTGGKSEIYLEGFASEILSIETAES